MPQSFPYEPNMPVMTPDGPGIVQEVREPTHRNHRAVCAQSAIEYAITQGARLDPKTEYYSMSATVKLESGETNMYHALSLATAPQVKPRIKQTTVVVTPLDPTETPIQALDREHHNIEEVLHCREGHTWTRPGGQRGRKPLYCPEHQPSAHEPELQHLHCKEGHEWTRPAQRGAKPEYCPMHKPEPQKPAERRTVAPRASNGDEATVTNRVSADALAILQAPNADPELQRKLQYVVSVLSDPTQLARRDPGDVNMIVKRQQELVHEYKWRSARI